ncbi:stress-activated map kinase interacting protein 1-domain-containing protein [Phascolomyces articulosus]|uniref:Stress-activated map kinase interacting protein 1-domain-containing protein n=1 Tax=Phascolomyces articulosus TaxID=60185 RepID=A0AAD5K1Q3_9FUNG|nr:stress-activated map kinase interacting protein 1-domain-containing protein [Phascolomyces articulosus]
MSLITDANFLIHEMRIKLLRTDERGERIVSFRPTVMSDDYIRLAAPTYPEMQYCYSPTYDNFFTKGSNTNGGGGTNLVSSPRTKRSHYRLRKKENVHPLNSPMIPKPATTPESGNEETDGDLGTNKPLPPTPMRKQSAPTLCVTEASKSLRPRFADDTGASATTATSLHKETVIRSHTRTTSSTTFSFHGTTGSENATMTSLHPSIESPIDPSPRSSLDVDNDQASFPLTVESASEKESNAKSIEQRQRQPLVPTELQKQREASQEEEEQQYSPLEYTKIQIPPLYNKIEEPPKPTVPAVTGIPGITIPAVSGVSSTTSSSSSTTNNNNNPIMPPLKLAPNLPTAHRRRRYPRQQVQQQQSPSPQQVTPPPQLPPQQPQHQVASTSVSQQQTVRRPPKSNLTAMIAERASAADNPFNEFSFVSGRGETKPITLCVYLPHSIHPYEPISLVVRPDAIVDDVLGYILYDYVEKKRKPSLQEEMYDIAQWELRLAEDDGEIEDGIPAMDRTRQISMVAFAQFALCRTAPGQVKQNEMIRAKLGRTGPDLSKSNKSNQPDTQLTIPPAPSVAGSSTANTSSTAVDIGPLDPITVAPPFTSHQEADSSVVAVPIPSSKAMLTKSTMPMTPVKYFRIRLMTNEEVSATTTIPVYAEMFIGDVLELLSRKRKLDPDEHMLTIADTNVIVPNDTTVDSMGGVTELCLMKKGAGLTVSSSTHIWRSPNRKKKEEPLYYPNMYNASSSTGGNNGILSQYKRYFVNRKMPMFVGRRESVLAIDGDYIQIMPPEHKSMFDSVKTASFHVSTVVLCKQSKKAPVNFKITVVKDQSHKAYDFEAMNSKEARKFDEKK